VVRFGSDRSPNIRHLEKKRGYLNPPIGQTPSRRAKLGPLRKLRIAAAGTAGSLLGVAILVGTTGR
jgi:hypothetical protein